MRAIMLVSYLRCKNSAPPDCAGRNQTTRVDSIYAAEETVIDAAELVHFTDYKYIRPCL